MSQKRFSGSFNDALSGFKLIRDIRHATEREVQSANRVRVRFSRELQLKQIRFGEKQTQCSEQRWSDVVVQSEQPERPVG